MDNVMARYQDQYMEKMNPYVLSGPTAETFGKIVGYLDAQFRLSIKTVEDLITYEGVEDLSPKKEYETSLTTSKFTHDVTASYFIKKGFKFKYLGVDLPTSYIYIPYTDDGVTFKISDTTFTIANVLTDPVISIDGTTIFTRIHKDKVNFLRIYRRVLLNGAPHQGEVVFSPSLFRNKMSTVPQTIKHKRAVPPIALYLFAKYGIKNTFKRYCGLKSSDWMTTATRLTKSDRDRFTIIESIAEAPVGFNGIGYVPHKVKIILPKDADSKTISYGVSLMYILDYYPSIAKEILQESKLSKEKEYWEGIMVRMMLPETFSLGKAGVEISRHMASLDEYLNPFLLTILMSVDPKIENFFDLLDILIDHASTWIGNDQEGIEQPFNRYFETLYYILYIYIVSINRIVLEIDKKSQDGVLSHKEVTNIFKTKMPQKALYSLTTALPCLVVDSTVDHKYLKIASTAEFQQRGIGVNKGKKSTIPRQYRSTSAESIIVGTPLFLTKGVPVPWRKINTFAPINKDTGRVEPDEQTLQEVHDLDPMLTGRISEDTLPAATLQDVEKLSVDD